MQTFEISNPESGVMLGLYKADTEAQALDAMARDAGYSSWEQCCEAVGQTPALIVSKIEG